MCSVEFLREFVTERLTAAAEEIFGVFEKKIVEYEEKIDRQRKLLDVVWKPVVQLHRLELPDQHSCKENKVQTELQVFTNDRNSSFDQEDPESSHIKEELEELCTFQEGEQLELIPNSFLPESGQFLSLGSPLAERDSGSSSNAELMSHCNTQVGERCFKCDSCGKEFKHKYKLMTHLRIHTGEKPYGCNTCGKRFRQKNALKAHLRIHTGEKPYTCKTCGRAFKNSGSVVIHMRRAHTGEKPYSCITCGKSFYESSSLRQHVIIHTCEQPYSCEKCGGKFPSLSSLQKHKRSHTGEKSDHPNTCGTRFSTPSALKNQMQEWEYSLMKTHLGNT